MRGVTPALSACRRPFASPPCGEWKSLPRHRSNRPQLNCLALGRPQIPAQLSASVRPGGSFTEAKCWAVRFPVGRGRPAPTKPNKTETEFRKVLVGTGRGVRRAEASPERGCFHFGLFCWRVSSTGVPLTLGVRLACCLVQDWSQWRRKARLDHTRQSLMES